jgi:hypothetical protein
MFASALPGDIAKGYALQGRRKVVIPTGLVTLIAAKTTTAGEIFTLRWPSSAASLYLRRLRVRYRMTTAMTVAAQEMGAGLWLAHAYTVNGTNGTAIDLGTTIADTGEFLSTNSNSLLTAGCCRAADTAAITAGTRTLDAYPIGLVSAQVSGIGDTVPDTSGDYATLFDGTAPGAQPIQFNQNQGFSVCNTVLMGTTGVGRWDIEMEWDEGVPQT